MTAPGDISPAALRVPSCDVKIDSYLCEAKSGCQALRRFVLPRGTVERDCSQRPHGKRPVCDRVGGMAALAVFDQGLHSGAMNCLRDSDAGTNGNGATILDHRNKGLPVTDIRQPIVKTPRKRCPLASLIGTASTKVTRLSGNTKTGPAQTRTMGEESSSRYLLQSAGNLPACRSACSWTRRRSRRATRSSARSVRYRAMLSRAVVIR